MPEFGSSISGAIVRCSTKTAGRDEVLIYDVEVVVVSGFEEVSGNRWSRARNIIYCSAYNASQIRALAAAEVMA